MQLQLQCKYKGKCCTTFNTYVQNMLYFSPIKFKSSMFSLSKKQNKKIFPTFDKMLFHPQRSYQVPGVCDRFLEGVGGHNLYRGLSPCFNSMHSDPADRRRVIRKIKSYFAKRSIHFDSEGV